MKLWSRSFSLTMKRRWKQAFLGVFVMGALLILVMPDVSNNRVVSTGVVGGVVYEMGSLLGFDMRTRVLRSAMYPPSIASYNLTNPEKVDFSRGQAKIIDDLLEHKKNGFFMEVGAGDGETNSVSLFFEQERRWTGVLVEGDPAKVKVALTKHRRCIVWNVWVSTLANTPLRALSSNEVSPKELFTLLERTDVDLLIVNLNGQYSDFLRSLNLDLFNVRVITVEMPSDVPRETYFEVTNHLLSRGYTVAHHLIFEGKKDVVYVNK